MAVTVVPARFTFVDFEAPTIERVVEELLQRLAMAELSVHVDVDESSPIVRMSVEDGDPVLIRAESGAFEDPRRPRQLSEENLATNVGRALLRLRDRRDGSFADAPPDAELTLPQVAAWDVYSVGRLGRAGYRVHAPRWRYNFRNRHAFSDAADAVFDRLWSADGLTWSELVTASDAARPA